MSKQVSVDEDSEGKSKENFMETLSSYSVWTIESSTAST